MGFKDDIRGERRSYPARIRKTADKIQRDFTCSIEKCQKRYGSLGSLRQHILRKHPDVYKPKYSKNKHKFEEEERI